ncbi:MAG: hypothetical protein ACTSPB_02500 [Candidatus Thorarchaeota archaeon]
MQDPLVTLFSALKTNWSLTGDLAPENIRFSTGWFEEDVDFPQITISEISDRNEPFELGYGTIRVTATYQIDIWVPILRTTAKGPGLAKQHKWKMREEIKRILKTNLIGLQDLRYVVLDQTGRNLDELDRSPPILRYSLDVSVVYDIT